MNRTLTKLTIGSRDDEKLNVVAHYNPKEIDLAHQTNWSDEESLKGMVKRTEPDLYNDLQYTGSQARTMALELFLDCYEPSETARESVETIVRRLHQLASPIDEGSIDPQRRRPHICLVAWGKREFPTFRCVIESLAVKYTMFSGKGHVLRAVCSLKLKEVRLTKELRWH